MKQTLNYITAKVLKAGAKKPIGKEPKEANTKHIRPFLQTERAPEKEVQ